jgi:hypothetical protein
MTDITHKIENYVNSQNQNIWNELKDQYQFQFIYDPSEYSWMGNTKDGVAIITTPNLDLEYNSFTHELLHIYLDYKGISEIDELVYGIIGEHSFAVLLEDNLVGALYNFCSHKKMFPYYQQMGFSEYNFVQERINFGRIDLFMIKLFFTFKKTKPKGVNQFIGHSLSLMNNVVKEDNSKCQKYLNKLKKYKPDLFELIERFDTNWNEQADLNLVKLFLEFELELNEWLIKRKITTGNNA